MRAAVLPLLCLAACTSQPKRDKVVYSAQHPVQLTVRRHETRVKPPCTETGLDAYKCLFQKAERHGCVYLDVGTPYEDAASDDPCTNHRPERLELASEPRDVDFELDAAGERFAWRVDLTWSVTYLWNGRLLLAPRTHVLPANYELDLAPLAPFPAADHARSTLPVDWRALKTLDEALPDLYLNADPNDQPQLLKRLQKLGGERAVGQMLLDHFDYHAAGWPEAFDVLSASEQRRVADGVLHDLDEGGTDEGIAWLDEHPELKPKDFEQRLLARAQQSLITDETDATSRWLTRGYQKHLAEVGPLACKVLEVNELSNTWGMGEGGYSDATPYGIIALTHTRCPVVTRTLEPLVCGVELRCLHPLGTGEESGADAEVPTELCDERDLKQLATAMADGQDSLDWFDGAAKMGALLAQGPPSKAFVLANARRSYKLLRPDAGTDDEREVMREGSPLCEGSTETLSDFFCKLRPDQTHFVMSRCEVELDDVRHTVRLTPLDLPDGGLMRPALP